MTGIYDTPTSDNGAVTVAEHPARRGKKAAKTGAMFADIAAQEIARADETVAAIDADIAYYRSLIADRELAKKTVLAGRKVWEKETGQ